MILPSLWPFGPVWFLFGLAFIRYPGAALDLRIFTGGDLDKLDSGLGYFDCDALLVQYGFSEAHELRDFFQVLFFDVEFRADRCLLDRLAVVVCVDAGGLAQRSNSDYLSDKLGQKRTRFDKRDFLLFAVLVVESYKYRDFFHVVTLRFFWFLLGLVWLVRFIPQPYIYNIYNIFLIVKSFLQNIYYLFLTKLNKIISLLSKNKQRKTTTKKEKQNKTFKDSTGTERNETKEK